MEICLICTENVKSNSKSINDCIGDIQIVDILYDLNYKFPFENNIKSDKICLQCSSNLLELYDFRENCCGLFDIENKNCKICYQEGKLVQCTENVSLNSTAITRWSMVKEICSFDLEDQYSAGICHNCSKCLIRAYCIHLNLQKSLHYWMSRVLHRIPFKRWFPTSSKPARIPKVRRRVAQTSTTKDFLCEVCSKTFHTLHYLKIHLKTHTAVKPFVCKLCSKSFTYQSRLKYHMRVHSSEKPFLCEICAKSFNRIDLLKVHKRTSHSDCNKLKTFECMVCSKKFRRIDQLNVHMRIHTGERPYKCDICSKAFGQNVTLKQHLLRIHTAKKQVMRCEVCSKGYLRPDKLNEHMRLHTGEKPYKCPICGEDFSLGRFLKKHLQSHSVKMPD